MPNHPHAFLTDLLASDCSGREFGCGLEPRLLEMLLDRHAVKPGTVSLDRAIRHDGPMFRDHTHAPR